METPQIGTFSKTPIPPVLVQFFSRMLLVIVGFKTFTNEKISKPFEPMKSDKTNARVISNSESSYDSYEQIYNYDNDNPQGIDIFIISSSIFNSSSANLRWNRRNLRLFLRNRFSESISFKNHKLDKMLRNRIQQRVTRLSTIQMISIGRTTKLTYVLLSQILQKHQQIQLRNMEQQMLKWRQRRLRHRIRALPQKLLTKSVHTRLYLFSAE